MFPIFKLFVDFVPRIEKNTSFDNFSEELLYPSKKSPVYSTLPCSKLILSKASDFLDKNLVPEKPYVLFSDKVVLIDTTKPIEMLSLFIPLQEQPFVLFDGFIPLLSNSALDLDYFKKIYAKDALVLSNLKSLSKQYVSLCEQFDNEINDTGFGDFISERYSSLSYIASDPEIPDPPDIPIEDLIEVYICNPSDIKTINGVQYLDSKAVYSIVHVDRKTPVRSIPFATVVPGIKTLNGYVITSKTNFVDTVAVPGAKVASVIFFVKNISTGEVKETIMLYGLAYDNEGNEIENNLIRYDHILRNVDGPDVSWLAWDHDFTRTGSTSLCNTYERSSYEDSIDAYSTYLTVYVSELSIVDGKLELTKQLTIPLFAKAREYFPQMLYSGGNCISTKVTDTNIYALIFDRGSEGWGSGIVDKQSCVLVKCDLEGNIISDELIEYGFNISHQFRTCKFVDNIAIFSYDAALMVFLNMDTGMFCTVYEPPWMFMVHPSRRAGMYAWLSKDKNKIHIGYVYSAATYSVDMIAMTGEILDVRVGVLPVDIIPYRYLQNMNLTDDMMIDQCRDTILPDSTALLVRNILKVNDTTYKFVDANGVVIDNTSEDFLKYQYQDDLPTNWIGRALNMYTFKSYNIFLPSYIYSIDSIYKKDGKWMVRLASGFENTIIVCDGEIIESESKLELTPIYIVMDKYPNEDYHETDYYYIVALDAMRSLNVPFYITSTQLPPNIESTGEGDTYEPGTFNEYVALSNVSIASSDDILEIVKNVNVSL